MSIDTSSPPLATIDAALRKTTERLACDLAGPADAAPQWSDFEWRIAMAVATMHGISGLLADTLSWAGPEYWQAFLTGQKHQAVLREQHVHALLNTIDALAGTKGIALVALKGATLIRQNLYAPGQRPMGDIDLLVRHGDVPACAELLQQAGYRSAFANRRHTVFAPAANSTPVDFGEHVDNPLKVEVHEVIAERLPCSAVDITDQTWPVAAVPGLHSYSSNATALRHLLLHAAGNMRARAARLIQFHDIALLTRRMSRSDWEELLPDQATTQASWWMLPPLRLTARYYGAAIPLTVIASVEPFCPRALRRAAGRHQLADISWSQIRIPAFPGIEWSRSITETLQFMKSRIWPGRRTLQELRVGVDQMPQLSRIPWYGQSHATRIARWMFSQPPRVQTLHSVRRALGSHP
ncbi:MAG TPA: nucleotidyltransferase family protein [Povalibacter sp.]|nr:nucleotidyltransferase family protein [Povalibacter sp.]